MAVVGYADESFAIPFPEITTLLEELACGRCAFHRKRSRRSNDTNGHAFGRAVENIRRFAIAEMALSQRALNRRRRREQSLDSRKTPFSLSAGLDGAREHHHDFRRAELERAHDGNWIGDAAVDVASSLIADLTPVEKR